VDEQGLRPDRPRVFCLGLNKTGTSSFSRAMELLGLRSLHWGGPEVRRRVEAALAAGRPLLSELDPAFDAFSDVLPLAEHFTLLDEQYPGSRFVLTVRPVEEWIDSRRRHVENNLRRREAGEYTGSFVVVDEAGWRREWDGHVARVRAYFAGRRDFLELDITRGKGWGPLCALLDRPVPATPFPWANRYRRYEAPEDVGEVTGPRPGSPRR
jgi:Sulfotransferase domain